VTNRLFILLNASKLQWLAFNSRGESLFDRAGDDEALKGDADVQGFEGEIIAVVPGEDVLVTAAQVPSRRNRQILQDLPYAIEEQIAMDVDDCFFTIGARQASGEIQVGVVSRMAIENWVSRLDDLAIKASHMVPEQCLLSRADGTSIFVDGDRIHINWSDSQALTTSIEGLALTVSMIDAKDRLPIRVFVQDDSQEKIILAMDELSAAGEVPEIVTFEEPSFSKLVSFYQGSQLNLLQGPYLVDQVRSPIHTVWRSVAILAACALVLHLGVQIAQGLYLHNKAEQYSEQSRALYENIFPADKNVRDIKRRWDAHIGIQTNQNESFISLVARSAQGLSKAGLTLNNVNFNESRGDLILQVIAERSEALVQYVQSLSGEGLNAEIGTISQEGDSIRGSVKIRASDRSS
jgi:general secretion pathway protein L